jgi:outer membrane protein insertion porin family
VFKYRLNAGVLTKINNRQIPRVEKFMMGGPQNLRGYYYNTIGPKVRGTVIGTSVDEDFNQGGYGKFLTTLELEHPLVSGQSVKWVVFMDAGNVYSSFKEFSDLELKLDYGFGLRIFLPIGIFRLEYGIPVGDGGPQFNIDIGQSF